MTVVLPLTLGSLGYYLGTYNESHSEYKLEVIEEPYFSRLLPAAQLEEHHCDITDARFRQIRGPPKRPFRPWHPP